MLWTCGLHHQNVSENNLMYIKIEDHVVGVLNDFDPAIINNEDREVASERTGTIPFMAYDLLKKFNSQEPIVHIYGM